jgi:uncharacterized protein YbaP (TraB family)
MFLWKIKVKKRPSYLFGTIHVPYTRVWDSIPAKVKRAFRSSDMVMVELKLSDPRTLSALNECQLLPGSQRLRQVLPRDLFRRIKNHLQYVRSQMPSWLPNNGMRETLSEQLFQAITKDWERKRPIWVMLMINSLTEHDIKSRGIPVLDTFLTQEAERLKKLTGAVEGVQEQCNPLNGLNSTQVLYILNRTMIQHEAIRRGLVSPQLTTDDSIRQYICGNFQSQLFDAEPTPAAAPHRHSNPDHVESGGSPPRATSESPIQSLPSITEQITGQKGSISDEIDAYFRSEMIHKRNKQMAERIMDMLNQNPDTIFFFAFGAAHFLGNNSVISFIEKGGFRVVPVTKSKRGKHAASSGQTGITRNP